jgi:hypothetical protein
MTLGIAWIREVGGIRELLVASDSRLSGGQAWDGNAKIMTLPRSDAVLSFAGNTEDAYPLMIQAFNAIKMYAPAENRAMDIADLKGHLLRVFDHSRSFISALPHGKTRRDDPDAIFMLSGYSWKSKRFHIWTLHYDKSIERFTFRPATEWGGQDDDSHKMIAYVGDADAIHRAKELLVLLLRERGKIQNQSFDMEPFEVLRDVIRSNLFPAVGGPIQLVKIYEHSNAVPVGVYWPSKIDGTVCVLGRPLMDYETLRWGVIDPDDPDRARPVDGISS